MFCLTNLKLESLIETIKRAETFENRTFKKDDEKKVMQKKIAPKEMKCFRWGKSGHVRKDCEVKLEKWNKPYNRNGRKINR